MNNSLLVNDLIDTICMHLDIESIINLHLAVNKQILNKLIIRYSLFMENKIEEIKDKFCEDCCNELEELDNECNSCNDEICFKHDTKCDYCDKYFCKKTVEYINKNLDWVDSRIHGRYRKEIHGCAGECHGCETETCCRDCLKVCFDEKFYHSGCGESFCPDCLGGCRDVNTICYRCQDF